MTGAGAYRYLERGGKQRDAIYAASFLEGWGLITQGQRKTSWKIFRGLTLLAKLSRFCFVFNEGGGDVYLCISYCHCIANGVSVSE